MGVITDLIFGLGDVFQWTFTNVLVPIGYYADWLLFVLGAGLLTWWCVKLAQFGSDEEKNYDGI